MGEAEDRASRAGGANRSDDTARRAPDPEQADAGVERPLDAQRYVARLSRELLALQCDEIEAGIRAHLASAAELAGADRTRLVVLDPDGSAQPVAVYDGCAPGVAPAPLDFEECIGSFHWATRCLSRAEPIRLESIDDLPAEALAERRDMAARNIRSLLALPVRSRDAVIGVQVFECVERRRIWTDDEIELLNLGAEILVGAARRQRTEQALRQSEMRFRAIAEHATELVAEFDAKGCFRYASSGFERRLGHSPAQLLGRPIQQFMHGADFEALSGIYAEAARNESEVRAIHRLQHRDGHWRWIESSGRAIRMANGEIRLFFIGRDITERRAVEEAVDRQLDLEKRIAGLSRQFLSLQTAEIDDAIRRALVEAAALAGADRCFLSAFETDSGGYRAHYEWCGEGAAASTDDRCPWFDRKIAAGLILNFASIDEMPPEAERKQRSLHGRGVRSLLAIPIRSGDRTIGLLGFETLRSEQSWFEHDITLLQLIGEILTSALGRMHAESALQESESMLLQAQKLEAVGRLAGGIAHDFNNLLTVILGFSRPLLRELAEGDPTREDVAEIHAAAERAASLTRQLLTFSRRQAIAEQVVDLSATLSGLGALLERLLGEDVELILELEAELAGVKGDAHQFEQVVINLVANARDAMPDGGTLKISTSNQTLDASCAHRIGLLGAGHYAVLSVSDSGWGMDEDTRAQIFDPFFTTKEPGKGTGLGLSIAYSVVKQAGGAIHVDGGPSKGTTFDIWLPAVERAVVEEPAAERESEEPGSGCVLLVEDEPSLRRLACRILESNGYRVIEAADGAEALEVAAAFDDPIDALVTDVVMPRLGGIELARRLRRDRPEVGLLFMSGYPDDRARGAEGFPPGATVIEKPFRSNAFLAKLRAALRVEVEDGDPR
jgi:PAS domain S-box-containing protein